MKKSAILAVLALGLGLSGFYGCEQQKSDAIAVIPKGTTHSFWKTVHAGAAKAGKEFNVKIIWKGPLMEGDREGQIKVVEDFTSQGVKGIVLAPLDDTALQRPVASAAKAGIPVVVIDSDLKGKDFVSFVATDNFKGGQMAGEHLAKILGDKGKVIMLRYQEGSASTENRERGFLDALKQHPGIEIVSSNQYGQDTSAKAQDASERLLAPLKSNDAAKPGLTIDGIFCPNESTTEGMLGALRAMKVAGTVKFVGFDSNQMLVDALGKGEIQGLILQNPAYMGYMGVKVMVQHLKGEKVNPREDTGVKLVTKDNMNEPAMQELLKPPQE